MRMISYDAQGNVVSDQTTPATTDEVTAERDRRIDDSFVFNGVSYQCRAADRENIAGAAQLAFMAKVTGQPFSLQWIAEDNSTVTMDADAVIAFASAAAQRKSAHDLCGPRAEGPHRGGRGDRRLHRSVLLAGVN
jgi:hypothetical protein